MAAEQAKSRETEQDTESDAPYAGLIGRTRSEAVQVWLPDDSIRALSVHTGIDAAADPDLAQAARAGSLHELPEGVELAIPFTYHDPALRLFVLVLPEGLRHRALALRAELMLALAADTQHAVPDYVRNVELVVGSKGLCERLEAGESRATPVRVDGALAAGPVLAARALFERERALKARERLLEARERALRRAEPGLAAIRESDVEELDELDDPSDEEEDAVYEPDLDEAADSADDADDESELEEVEDLDDGDALDDGEESEGFEDASHDVAVFDPALAPEPAQLGDDPSRQLWLTESAGHAWLFVRGRPGSRRQDAEMELLVQLDPTLDPAVVLVALVFDVDGSPEVRRGVVDVADPAQFRALHLLAQHFAVGLVSVAHRESEHFATLHTPREGNVRAILKQLERAGPPDRARWEEASAAVLGSPPPWRDLTHPFQGDPPEAPLTATEAAVLLDELAEWLTPERRARVRLLLCVPDRLVDASYRAGIGYALDWGLKLSRELATRALELGMAKDEGELLERRIEGLCRTSREPDFAGLGPGVMRAEWSDALEQAARLGVSLSDDARELALKHAGARALVHATALCDKRDASLDPAREKAHADPPEQAALEELLSRGGYRDVLDACRLSNKLSPEVSGALFATVARRDDPVALDALLSLLSFSEPLLVRAGAALALASRRALNALDDLAGHVAHEGEPEFQVFALALGRYGAGSFRAISRALRKYEVQAPRAELVYAHLALHGARAQVRAKARGREPHDAQLAERALLLASELKDGKKPAVGLEQQGDLTVFCEIFDRHCRDVVT
ncbi:MAG: Methyltransferase type 11 [Myxococcaceae bacterium]|nr:Methyltransferase type 11 [Myxococcaceae bacterium]